MHSIPEEPRLESAVAENDENSSYSGVDRLFRSCSLTPSRLRWPWVVAMIVAAVVALFIFLSFKY